MILTSSLTAPWTLTPILVFDVVTVVDDLVDGAQHSAASSDILGMLSFQRLDVYRRAIEFVAYVYEIVEALPPGHATRAQQLVDSAESVIRNIAEGAGRWSKLDMAKHYKIARGEAMESAASLDVLDLRGALEKPRYQRGIALLEAIVSMLTRMIDR